MSHPRRSSELREVTPRHAAESVSVVDLPTTPTWRRRARRIRVRPLSDPLGQGLLALFTAVAAAITGAWLLLVHQSAFGTPALILSAALATIYTTLAFRAFKRDKAVQYWHERQRLELELTREEQHRAVLSMALDHLHSLQRGDEPLWMAFEGTLEKLVDGLYTALTARHDDVAVVLARQHGRRCRILHSSVSAGGRWKELRTDKECVLDGTFEEKLADLSRYNRAFEVDTARGRLRLAILHDTRLSEEEARLLQSVRGYLEMVSQGWGIAPVDRVGRLGSVG